MLNTVRFKCFLLFNARGERRETGAERRGKEREEETGVKRRRSEETGEETGGERIEE